MRIADDGHVNHTSDGWQMMVMRMMDIDELLIVFGMLRVGGGCGLKISWKTHGLLKAGTKTPTMSGLN